MQYELTPPPPPKPRLRPWLQITLGLAILISIGGAFAAALFFVVEKSFRSSDAYSMALSRAQVSPCVIAMTGTPVLQRGFVSGNIEVNGASGSADFSMPISGPRGKGDLNVSTTKIEGSWALTSLSFTHDQTTMQLLPDASPCQ